MKKLVVLTGAGISAESGLATFRGQDGLWEGHRIEEVASPIAWDNNPELVLHFYNLRRAQLKEVEPNAAHLALKDLEAHFDVHIITQNVDNLHERAGSTKIIHLHGELTSVRTKNFCCQQVWHEDLHLGHTCEHGQQFRPDIVWFGEDVPMIEPAIEICSQADILLIIGTSLQVYPAASLMHYCNDKCMKFYIDPGMVSIPNDITHIQEGGTKGMEIIVPKLKSLA